MSDKKSWFFAYGLLFFFGSLGLHRFYLDKPWTGILWLCSGGLLGIGLVYDFFALPFHLYFANNR